MTPTNQFKVHGQLPLHGMTVSVLFYNLTQTALNWCHQFLIAANKQPQTVKLQLFHTPPSTHNFSTTTRPSCSLLFYPHSLFSSLPVYFGPCCPRYRCFPMFLCVSLPSPDQREWRWVGRPSRLHNGRTATVGGGGSKVRTVDVNTFKQVFKNIWKKKT